jgi:hypothetical protein
MTTSVAADGPDHELALLGPEGVELEQVRRLDDAVHGAEQVGGGLAGHDDSLSGRWHGTARVADATQT